MKIGSIELGDRPLFLAPMEDVTDPSFRYICKQFGADVVYTEFISSDGLIRDAKKSLKKLDIYEHERPVGIQIYGHLIEPMVEAAKIAEAAKPDLIDINFGCPVRKIAARGAGSGMMMVRKVPGRSRSRCCREHRCRSRLPEALVVFQLLLSDVEEAAEVGVVASRLERRLHHRDVEPVRETGRDRLDLSQNPGQFIRLRVEHTSFSHPELAH